MELNENNIEIYAAKYYRSESCLSKEEFLDDLGKHKLAKKLKKNLLMKNQIMLDCYVTTFYVLQIILN